MKPAQLPFVIMMAFLSTTGIAETALAATQTCNVTAANGQTAPDVALTPGAHGNGKLWTVLWPTGNVVFDPKGPGFVEDDGALRMKFPWWKSIPGMLRIEGRRLDAQAPPLRVDTFDEGEVGFQPTSLIFPTPGCWEVTGRVGDATLTFVTNVVKIGEGHAKWPGRRVLRPKPQGMHFRY